jgi:hypothetical protein
MYFCTSPISEFETKFQIPTPPGARERFHLRVHFGRYGYGLLMKNFSLGLYIFLNIQPK